MIPDTVNDTRSRVGVSGSAVRRPSSGAVGVRRKHRGHPGGGDSGPMVDRAEHGAFAPVSGYLEGVSERTRR